MIVAKSATWSYLKRAWGDALKFKRASRSLAETGLEKEASLLTCWILAVAKSSVILQSQMQLQAAHEGVPNSFIQVLSRIHPSPTVVNFFWIHTLSFNSSRPLSQPPQARI